MDRINFTAATLAAFLFCGAAGSAAAAPDAEAAQALIRKNNCNRCHALDKEKQGPAFQRVARENRGAGAVERLITHLTTGPVVTLQDGHEERHKVIQTTPDKDIPQVRNLVEWLLAQ